MVTAYLRHLSSRRANLNFTANTPELSYLVASAADLPQNVDAVAVAEQILNADRSWLRSICDGLAQASPDDIRAVSFLATLTHSVKDEGGIEHHACRALGRLAARGGVARRWVASMYLSGSFIELTCSPESPHSKVESLGCDRAHSVGVWYCSALWGRTVL